MKKKILGLGFVFLLAFILLQSKCYAGIMSGNNKYYQVDDLGLKTTDVKKGNSIMGDIVEWQFASPGEYDVWLDIHSYEKYNELVKYNPELNYNGIYALDGYSMGDLNKAVKSQNTFLTQWCPGAKFIHKDLITINGYPAQRVTYYDDDTLMDIYAIEADNHIAWFCFRDYDGTFVDSKKQQELMNSFKFTNDTANKVMNIPFEDILTTDWYNSAVRYVYKNNIITGTTATTFKPNNKLTRGQLATILHRLAGNPKATGGKNFSDVKNTDYYYTAIKWASANGIVNGYKNGKFGPNDNVTREQLAVMLQNYARYKKQNTTKTANISKFKDVTGISDYAKNAVAWAIQNKIISGKENGTRIAPKQNTSRAEVAAMIQNYINYVK